MVSMNISFVRLFGSIPPEIGQFRNLSTLILYAMNLTGHLPSEMANLESLKIQNISTNTIIGELASI